MTSVYLLKTYNGKGVGSVIQVEEDVAFDLISQGVAREAQTRDYIVKPQFGKGKVVTRAFRSAPDAR